MTSPATIGVWLATPDAAVHFDSARLEGPERDEWQSLRTRRRREDWASSRALLRAVPAASGSSQSLSHSHGFAALARADEPVRIGVDIEWLSPRDFVGMARVAYSESEADALASLGHPDLLREAFYELWTLKEAFAKALQLPLVDSLRHCRLPVVGRVTGSTSIPTDQAWRATVFAPRPRLRLAVVAVAPTRDALSTALTTLEWPPFHPGEWPAVRRLEGAGGHADAAC